MNKISKLIHEPGFWPTIGYYGIIFCIGLNGAVLGPTLPALAEQTQARLGDMGQLFLFSAIGGTLGTLYGGRLFAHIRGHVVLGAVQIMSGLLMLFIPFMPKLGWLLAIIALKGVMAGISNNGANTLLIWTHRENLSPYMNGLHFSYGLGAFLAPIMVAQAIDISGAYRWIFVVLAILTVLVGLCIITLSGSPQAPHPADSESNAVQSRNIPNSIVLAAALFLFFNVGAEIAFSGWIYTYAVELKLVSAVRAAYLTSGFWLALTVGRLISVPTAIRFTPRRIITMAVLGCIFFTGLVVVFADSTSILWIATLGIGFCMAPLYASGFSLAVEGLKVSALASSVILMGDSVGSMILPWLVGQVLDTNGPRALVYLVLGSLICGLLAFVELLSARSKVTIADA